MRFRGIGRADQLCGGNIHRDPVLHGSKWWRKWVSLGFSSSLYGSLNASRAMPMLSNQISGLWACPWSKSHRTNLPYLHLAIPISLSLNSWISLFGNRCLSFKGIIFPMCAKILWQSGNIEQNSHLSSANVFLFYSLTKDPYLRPTPARMLEHPFIKMWENCFVDIAQFAKEVWGW